jgi:hypothetical protein
MTFLLIQVSGLSYAQVPSPTENPSPLTTGKQIEIMSAPVDSLNLFKEWGKSVIDHSLLSNNEVNSDQENDALLDNELPTKELLTYELFAIDKVRGLQQQINLRFQTGLYSLKNNYVLSSHYPMLISNQFLVPNLAQHDLYQFGRFRTETGYSDITNVSDKNFKAFLHSAYSLINRGRFNLSVTASIESIELAPGVTNLDGKIQLPVTIYNNEQSTSATLGVIGSFDLSNRWSLIGALTTSHLTNDKHNTLIVEESRQKMALIGTTYSF